MKKILLGVEFCSGGAAVKKTEIKAEKHVSPRCCGDNHRQRRHPLTGIPCLKKELLEFLLWRSGLRARLERLRSLKRSQVRSSAWSSG